MNQHLIQASEIYDKNLNFLFGSGASYGLLPTLELGVKRADGSKISLETLITERPELETILFMHYYETCIRPAQLLNLDVAQASEPGKTVVANYRAFLLTALRILSKRKPMDRRCNIFTTNYDGCFALVLDEILKEGSIDFVLNDGARGFSVRHLQARNFNSYLCQTGVFERNQTSIPQINLIHLHGSVYWKKHEAGIAVDYKEAGSIDILRDEEREAIQELSDRIADDDEVTDNIEVPKIEPEFVSAFIENYRKLPIVNPTKWKFHETVFEEHYYQMLRLMSYELEKPNSVLVTFGFSFGDEHILNLLKRSLSNPQLQVFVCCFDATEFERLSKEFSLYNNVECLMLDGEVMDFTAFNEKVLSVSLPDRRLEPELVPAGEEEE